MGSCGRSFSAGDRHGRLTVRKKKIMTKRVLTGVVLLGLVAGWLVSAVPAGHAQSNGATPTPGAPQGTVTPTPGQAASSDNEEVLLFSQLGLSDETMRGPFASIRHAFAVPADWELTAGAQLQLDFEVFPGSDSASVASGTSLVLGGDMNVSFNGVQLSQLLLNRAGEQSLTLDIPAAALIPSRSDGRHEFSLVFDSNLGCEVIQQPAVVLHNTSLLVLPHRSVLPPVDLSRLPYPIYQASFQPDLAAVVIPDRPTPGELQAALAVMTGFGKTTSGGMTLDLVPVSEVTDDLRRARHLILVGKPGGLPLLSEVKLPVLAQTAGFEIPGAAEEDGILQMAISPWNVARVVLVVSGNTDSGVVKAGQAISAGNIRVSGRPDLSVVAEVHASTPSEFVPVDRTFASLGYDNRTVRSASTSSTYFFDVPVQQGVQEGAYVDLIYNHSALLNYDRSALIINLNDQPIGSARLSDETTVLTTRRIPIPPSLVRAGVNRLSLQTTLESRDACADSRQQNVWLIFSADSLVHLPSTPVQADGIRRYDLSQYPAPFTFSPTLDKMAFVLPDHDPAAWRAAAQVVFNLGDLINVPLFDALVVFGDAIPEEVRQARDLLVVGRPHELPLVAELGDALPAPFEAASDVATERGSTVVYRLPAGVSVGYLQLLPAPWNQEHVILVVLGNSDESLQWVANALTISRLQSRLSGNYVVVNGEQIVAADTRLLPPTVNLVATAVPGGAVETIPVVVDQPIIKRPAWLLPVLGISIALMVLVIGLALVNAWQARRSAP